MAQNSRIRKPITSPIDVHDRAVRTSQIWQGNVMSSHGTVQVEVRKISIWILSGMYTGTSWELPVFEVTWIKRRVKLQ